jgi:hypothetical protein
LLINSIAQRKICHDGWSLMTKQSFEELKPASHVPILGTILNIFDVFVAVFFSLLNSLNLVERLITSRYIFLCVWISLLSEINFDSRRIVFFYTLLNNKNTQFIVNKQYCTKKNMSWWVKFNVNATAEIWLNECK